jgi:hypothetical protein
MVVKVRFGRGAVVSRRSGKNRRLARLAASLLTLVSISCGALGVWRLGTDLDWAGDFVFPSGLLSHWQVWIAAAVAVQYLSWRLARYARQVIAPGPEAGSAEDSATTMRVTTNV